MTAVRRGARLLLALVIAWLTVTVAAPTASGADEPAQVLIEQVAPANPRPRSTITVSGRIANTGDNDLVDPVVQLRFSPTPLNSRSELLAVFDGASERIGSPIGEPQALPVTLTPGQQSAFRLQVPVADLGLPTERAGSYAFFVELLAGEVTVATAGTAIPWFPPDADYRPSGVAWAWPVVQQPALAAEQLVVEPALPQEFTATGRLSQLLDTGRQAPVSWLVDAATLDAAATMANGYQVATAQGPQPGDETEAAAAFAANLRETLQTHPGTAVTQYALGDADALTTAGMTDSVTRDATLPATVLDQQAPHSDAGLLYWAPGGSVDPATATTLVAAGVRRMLLSDAAVPPDPTVPYTPSGVTSMTVAGTDVTVLLSDSQLSRTLMTPLDSAAGRCRARQLFLTDTAMITLERPAEPRDVIALPRATWHPPAEWLQRLLRSLRRAPWIRLVQFDDVAAHLGEATASATGESLADVTATSRPLPVGYLQRIRAAGQDLDRLLGIMDDPSGYATSYTAALQRAGSALWRNKPVRRNTFLSTVERQLAEQRAQVRVASTGTVTLPGESGVLPLTIANDLDRAVTVGVRLTVDNPILMSSDPLPAVTVGANQKVGVEIPVRVVGNQPLTVRIVLTDRDGVVFDDSATLALRSTAGSRIALMVVGAGAAALILLSGINIYRRHRTRGRDHG